MALPIQIGAGVPLSWLSAPVQIGGAWYAVGIFTGGGASKARVYKATDPSSGWAAQDVAHEPNVWSGSSAAAAAAGTMIYLLSSVGASALSYATYSTATDTWVAVESPGTFGVTGPIFESLIVRASGEILAVDRDGPEVEKRASSTTWNVYATLAGFNGVKAPAALAPDDRVRVFYDPFSGSLLTRSVSADGTLDAQETVTSSARTAAGVGVARAALSYADQVGMPRTCALYADNRAGTNPLLSFARAVEGSTPAFTADIPVSSAPAALQPARLIVDAVTPGRTDVLYAMWVRSSDGALMLNHSSTPGDSWTHEQVARAGLAPQSVASWQQALYARGPEVVWGFTYQAAGGGFFYDEIPIRSATRGPLRMIV